MRNTIQRIDHWMTALHESGHYTIEKNLNSFDTSQRAAVLPGGAGVATSPLGLTARQQAIGAASGYKAEAMASRGYGPLARQQVSEKSGRNRKLKREFSKLIRSKAQEAHGTTKSDEEKVAGYCDECANSPEERQRIFEEVHCEAERLVSEYRDEILEVATELFLNGAVFRRGNPEHNAKFEFGSWHSVAAKVKNRNNGRQTR